MQIAQLEKGKKKKKRTFLFSCWLLKLFLIIARKAGDKSRCRRLKGDLGLSPKERILDKDFKGFQWLWWQVFPFLTKSPAPPVNMTWTVLSAAPNPCSFPQSMFQPTGQLCAPLCTVPWAQPDCVRSPGQPGRTNPARCSKLRLLNENTVVTISPAYSETSSKARLLQGDAYLSVDYGV